MTGAAVTSRVATAADLDTIADTISLAFHDDPTWSWAFPDPDRRPAQYAVFWRFMIAGALRYPWVKVADGGAAASVWIPPEGTELTEDDESRVAPMLEELVGPRSGDVLELIGRFDEAHPRDEPHFYLSLLGTHPAHAGRGLGMGLLAADLAEIDAAGMPAYLESSNPANNRRYERFGFEPVVEFFPPGGASPVTGMWRAARHGVRDWNDLGDGRRRG